MNNGPIPGRCPVCGGGPLNPLPLDYRVTASVAQNGHQQGIGGLLPYICEEQGHVFFVMAKDVQSLQEAQAS